MLTTATLLVGLTTPVWVLASLTVSDPSDLIPPDAWAADNAIVPDYNVPFISQQPSDRKF